MNTSLLMSIGRCSLPFVCECVNAGVCKYFFFLFFIFPPSSFFLGLVSGYFLNKFFFVFFCLVWNNLLVPGAQRCSRARRPMTKWDVRYHSSIPGVGVLGIP